MVRACSVRELLLQDAEEDEDMQAKTAILRLVLPNCQIVSIRSYETSS